MTFRPLPLTVHSVARITVHQAVQLDRKSLIVGTITQAKLEADPHADPSVSNIDLAVKPCSGCKGQGSASSAAGDTYTYTSEVAVNSPPNNQRRGITLDFKLETTLSSRIFFLVNPKVGINLHPAQFECDAEKVSNISSPGCVFPAVTPVVTFDGRTSKDATMPVTARHMADALKSGLPGKAGSGTYLTRSNSNAVRDRNRRAACPPSLKRPAGYDCDEYPFASTNEGGAANIKQARSFPYCKLNDPQRTGPLGFSRCFIPNKESGVQGSALNNGYTTHRIRNGDRFQVGWR